MAEIGQAASQRSRMVVAVVLAVGVACGPPPEDHASTSEAVRAKSCQTPGGPCDDGNPCTYGDTCSHNRTCIGTPYSCDDGNVCTNDACDGSGGCTFANNTASCSDGNACTSGDVCSAGACSGIAYNCDDGNACTQDACDNAGGCTHTLVANCGSCTGTSCSSGLAAPTLSVRRVVTGGFAFEISWTDNSTTADGFRVERTFDMGSTWAELWKVPSDTTRGYDGSVPVEQVACYRVFAFNAQGDSPPSETGCAAIPAAPTNLAVATVGGGIELTWIDNSALEDGYDVARSDSKYITPYAVLAHLSPDATSYRDDTAASDHTYYYFVYATRDGGLSGESNLVTGVLATFAPSAPTGVQARPSSSTAVEILWSDDSTNEAGFRVERSTEGGASWTTVGTLWFAPYVEGQFVDAGRTPEAGVCYRAIAYNDAGESPPSPLACATPPAAPTDLTATSVSGGILITWTDNSAVEDGYIVYLSSGYEGGAWDGVVANSTSYLDTGLVSGVSGYAVAASKDGGWSDFIWIASPWPPSSCANGIRDYDEGDVDCGGSCDTKCASGKHCWTDWDCASGVCMTGDVCQ
jgi:Dictyostelium (slime mold) repeat